MKSFRIRPSYASVVATLALFVALGGGAWAASTGLIGPSGVIHGCAPRHGGSLSVVKSGKRCGHGQVAINFNQKGPQGSRGAQGIQGPKGDTGGQGAPGTSGYQMVTSQVGPNTVQDKVGTATCPAGKIAISGGVDNDATGHAFVTFDRRTLAGPDTQGTWFAGTYDPVATDSWSLYVYAYCVNVAP
jgi:hypothetical protein